MTKPIEDSTNAAAIRAALGVPTAAELGAKYTKPPTGIPATDLDADPAGRTLLTATSAAERKQVLGLDQVNNTSDVNKPISTAQQTALDAKMAATLPAMQTALDAGTASQKAAFQASVSVVKNLVAGTGDSLMVGSAGPNNAAYSKAARHASNAWQDAGNFAVGGTRTDQILPQFALAAAKGARIVVANGGTNDLYQGVAEAALRTNWKANVAEAKTRGFTRYIDIGMPPTNVSAAMKTAHANHEMWRALYCFKNGIQHVDIWSPFATASGGWQSGYNVDNTHWASGIAKIAGDRINTAIKNPVSGYPQLLAMTDTASDVGTYIGNAISFSGQSGTTPATGWYHTGTGGTYSITAPDAGDFGSWYRCTMSGGVNAGIQAGAVTLASLGWAIGDRIAIGVRLRWVDVNGAMPLRVQINGVTPDHQPLWDEVGGLTGDDIYLYDEMTINSGTVIGLVFTGTGTGYFEINRPIVVNMTKLGFA